MELCSKMWVSPFLNQIGNASQIWTFDADYFCKLYQLCAFVSINSGAVKLDEIDVQAMWTDNSSH